MIKRAHARNPFSWCAAAASAGLAAFAWLAPADARELIPNRIAYIAKLLPPEPQPGECRGDIKLRGILADVLSDALRIDFDINTHAPQLILLSPNSTSGELLFQQVVAKYSIDPEKLKTSILRHQHINCKHAPVDNAATKEELARWTPAPNQAVAPGQPTRAPAPGDAPQNALQPAAHQCSVDLALPGMMKDIVSNALMRGLKFPEADVAAFLVDAEKKHATGPELLRASAEHFKVDQGVLAAQVEKFKHCNCGLDSVVDGEPRDDAVEVSAFAKDVTLHVVLHEMGHALIREFDIPVLANEETTADAFATYYLTTYMPDRAVDVLMARTTSLMIEARETPDVDWQGEHDDDARRAYQIAALAVAADPEKYQAVAAVVGMSADDIRKAVDYGGEIRRSWRRVLAPLWMPDGAASREARVICDPGSAFISRLCSDGLAREVESALRRFDWHSQVTIRFVDGAGKAGWSRSARTVTVHGAYVRRFIQQGARAQPGSN